MKPTPSKLPTCKVCLTVGIGKYRCPLDGIDYCSVVCFKQHKLTGCSSENTYTPIPLPLIIPDASTEDAVNDDRPTKRLKDLNWPLEPNEALWDDPLSRNDLKPLRAFEYEAIATSSALRSILIPNSSLLTTLSRLTALPRFEREASLRLLLSLPPDATPGFYRPSSAASAQFSTSSMPASQVTNSAARGGIRGRGRGGTRGRGRGGRGNSSGNERQLLESTPEERKEVVGFAEEIGRILADVRKQQ